jgi:hypothetical protein
MFHDFDVTEMRILRKIRGGLVCAFLASLTLWAAILIACDALFFA